MGASTPNIALYLPGGGSTGSYGADETADIDKINQNMVKIDTAIGLLQASIAGIPALPLSIANGGTGTTTAPLARTALGATTIGSTIFTAADQQAILTALGVTAIGKLLMQAADVNAARAAIELYVTNTEPVGAANGAIWGAWTP